MTIPNIQYKATNTELDVMLQGLVEHKLETLEKYFGEKEAILCEIEFEKETAHQSGKHFRVEVNLDVDGKLYRVEATEQNFEKAIDEVRDELDKQLRRDAKKQTTLFRRGGKMIKNMMRWGE